MLAELQHAQGKSTEAMYSIRYEQMGHLHRVPMPLVRVTTCGGFHIEVVQDVVSSDPPLARYRVITLEQRPRGSSTGLTLLKMLASRPEHYASKDWLAEYIPRMRSSDDEEEEGWGRGLVRIDNVVSLLRSLLCPPGIVQEDTVRKTLVAYIKNHKDSGPGYQLASLPLLWLDVDVIAATVQQACRQEQEGRDALAAWEQVYALTAKGSYLPQEPYSDWATDKRAEIDGSLKQAVLALRRLLLARYGDASEERVLVLLRNYWQTHPTDEDVLRVLMELLAKRECVQEALGCYQRLCELLKEEGREPIERTQQTMQNVSISKQRECAQDFPAYRGQEILMSRANDRSQITSAAHQLQQADKEIRDITQRNPLLSECGWRSTSSDGLQEDGSWPSSLWMIPSEHIAQCSSRAGVDNVASFDPSRRNFNTKFLQFLGGLVSTTPVSSFDSEVWEWFIKTSTHSSILNQESIDAFQRLLQTCWTLCDCGNMALSEHLLSVSLPSVQQLAHRQKDAARLAAEGLRLQSILSAHQLKMTEKLTQCVQSVSYARLADDPNTLAVSLHELTAALRYTRQSDALFTVFQEALSFCEHVSPLIRSGIYAGSAASFAQRGRRKEADFYIHLAYETLSETEKAPVDLAEIDNSSAHVAEYEGLVYLELGCFQKADAVFERWTHLSEGSVLSERNRLEMLNYQGRAALQGGDVAKYAECLEKGIEGAFSIQSKKRLSEALEIFTLEMPHQWLREPRMKQIVERFHLSRGN
ncbi:MAG: hypothetical protein H0U76_08640 [Ktedonobacteraceae bacterium]|nr:hypothetical protein [Ktedonobacteraceae bacterium]